MKEHSFSEPADLSDLNDKESWLVLFIALAEMEAHNYELWEQFKNQLLYQNRFYSKHPIVHQIQEKSAISTKTLYKGAVFYRARKYTRNDYYNKTIKYILEKSGRTTAEIKDIQDNLSTNLQSLLVAPHLFSNFEEKDTEPSLKSAWKKWKKHVRFKGYNRKESSAPPSDIISVGRINPAHIRYLYLSEDKYTPIYEMRPIIGQKISLARFKLNRNVKVYDLTLAPQDNSCALHGVDDGLYIAIKSMFSKPNEGQESEYLPTQFIAEEIKRMGFDGIRYNSALNAGGINLVLFNPEDCTAVSSDLIVVNNIKITYESPYKY